MPWHNKFQPKISFCQPMNGDSEKKVKHTIIHWPIRYDYWKLLQLRSGFTHIHLPQLHSSFYSSVLWNTRSQWQTLYCLPTASLPTSDSISKAAKSSMYMGWGFDFRSGLSFPCFVVTSGCRWELPSALCLEISACSSKRTWTHCYYNINLLQFWNCAIMTDICAEKYVNCLLYMS